ncbi:MAG: gas vesicle protein K [Pseudomonadota bacterium]
MNDMNKAPIAAFRLEDAVSEFSSSLSDSVEAGLIPNEISVDPETVERDLVKLVLTLVEFIRQLMEAQAIRRMENGSLTEDEEERVGETLWRAREKIIDLANELGIDPETLTLDLGPLGRLV